METCLSEIRKPTYRSTLFARKAKGRNINGLLKSELLYVSLLGRQVLITKSDLKIYESTWQDKPTDD
jgi:hypothetical protein